MLKDIVGGFGDILKDLFSTWEIWLAIFVAGLIGSFLVPFTGPASIWRAFLYFLEYTWWLWVFIILFNLFKELWLHYKREMYKKSLKWVLLELRVPRNIQKSPQAMEQVLTAIHALRNAPSDFKEKYIEGEVTRWFSLEMASFGGEIHFYIRIYAGLKNLVEASFFSYYPDIDIIEVPDYIDRLPKSVTSMYEEGFDLWGTEMLLQKEELYPIKTYADFEASPDEEKRFDPISSFLEVMGKLMKDEFVGIQLLIAPTGKDPMTDYDKWLDGSKVELEELRQQSKRTKTEINPGEGEFSMFTMRSPRQTEILKAVEENLSKPAFETLTRFVYISPRATFTDSYPRRGLIGAFSQYAALDMNGFTQNYNVSTRTKLWSSPYVFPKTRGEYRKARILFDYKEREIPPESLVGRVMTSYFFNWNASRNFLMNTKCIATLFHIPTSIVLTEPHLRHLESRKTGPSAGLAIFGADEEIERYK
ncbi:hypothetical protein M1413_01810 [Patescibacteria group bacterium]|nr:hypothetical protein [Patescibacteria group bacterium]MCL5114426.1 hypothetical protein [Patescibacteria group bacterium]